MKTSRMIFIIFLFLSLGQISFAQSTPDLTTGNGLLTAWKAAQKDMDHQGTMDQLSLWYSGFYSGFVDGVSGTLALMGFIDIPAGVTKGQIFRVVGKYLEDHPEFLHLTSNQLATRALKQAFPKT